MCEKNLINWLDLKRLRTGRSRNYSVRLWILSTPITFRYSIESTNVATAARPIRNRNSFVFTLCWFDKINYQSFWKTIEVVDAGFVFSNFVAEMSFTMSVLRWKTFTLLFLYVALDFLFSVWRVGCFLSLCSFLFPSWFWWAAYLLISLWKMATLL